MNIWKSFWQSVFTNNPIFRLVLGLCPTLAVTTSLENALGMGLAASFVLVCSNGIISSLRKVIPAAVHIPCYIVIVATFVTTTDLLMQAYLPSLSESLGIFIPLIVVNCIILGRAEAFASKNAVLPSLADGLGTGVGFTLALALIASVREIAGTGSLTVWGDWAFKNIHAKPVVLAVLPAGGFITLGLLLALINRLGAAWARRHGAPMPLPVALDCRHCTMCPNGK
ncbi:MAG: electron transport complex subunit RsxE [Kiritimatiellia bacterium]